MSVVVYVLCHDGNEREADNFCDRMNNNINCVYKKYLLRQSKYFENDFYFWWLEGGENEVRPEIKWIGLIVPHYMTKIGEVNFYKLSKNMGEREYFGFASCSNDSMKSHPGGMNLINKTLKKLGLINSEIHGLKATYYNYWLMTTKALKDYSLWVQKFYNLWDGISKDEELHYSMNRNSNYPLKKLTPQQLLVKTHFPYYTFHTFILERMHKIVLSSLGYLCEINREYNPDIEILEAIIYSPNPTNVTNIISNKIKNKLTFQINSRLLTNINSKITHTTITYSLNTIIKTITIQPNTILLPVFN